MTKTQELEVVAWAHFDEECELCINPLEDAIERLEPVPGESWSLVRADQAQIRLSAAEAERDALRAEVDRCHARLEIDHVFVAEGDELVRREVPMNERLSIPDAVECRDATISVFEAEASK